MPAKILIATPDPPFSELLRASLTENGEYEIYQAQTGSEVLQLAAAHEFALAILDSSLVDEPFVAMARSLLEMVPGLRLMVIPPDNDPKHPALLGLSVDGYLSRPFYLPELLEAVHGLLTSRNTRKPGQELAPVMVENSSVNQGQNWAEDPARASRQLARLLLQTSAQEAVIAYEGAVWARAGQLGDAAAQEIAGVLHRFTQEGKRVDIARFTRLESTGGLHLIYATHLLDVLHLALIFDQRVAFTRAGTQTNQIVATLTDLVTYPNELPPKRVTPPVEEKPAPVSQPAPEEELFGDDPPEIDLSILLAGMPPPDPDGPPLFGSSEWVPETDLLEDASPLVFPWETGANKAWAAAPEQAAPVEETPPEAAPVEESKFDESNWVSAFRTTLSDPLAETRPITALQPKPDPQENEILPIAMPDPIAALRAESLPLVPSDPLVRAGAPFGDQIYTCILLPVQPANQLAGDLGDQLGVWIPQLCLAFGWRLEGLSIQADYLQLIVRLAPGMSPGSVVRVLRQRLSERIYQTFPQQYRPGISGDFWAPGYLVVRGSNQLPNNQLRDFIHQTRRWQGYTDLMEPKLFL